MGPASAPLHFSWWRARPLWFLGACLAAGTAAGLLWYLASPLVIRTSLVESTSAIPSGSQALLRGAFADRDTIHRGSGTATLLRGPDGKSHLRLDSFRVTNGPDLFVYLTPAPSPGSHEDVTAGGALQVGRLKAAEGAFAYALPAGTDLSRFRSAVIYCFQFRTIFSVAPLAAA